MADRPRRLLAGGAIDPAHALERAGFAFEPGYFRLYQNFDVWLRRDAIAEITRHRRFEALAPHDHPDLVRLGREIDRGLAGGIASAHKCDFLAETQMCLDRRSPVMHMRTLVVGDVCNVEMAVLRAARDDHGA